MNGTYLKSIPWVTFLTRRLRHFNWNHPRFETKNQAKPKLKEEQMIRKRCLSRVSSNALTYKTDCFTALASSNFGVGLTSELSQVRIPVKREISNRTNEQRSFKTRLKVFRKMFLI